MSTQSRELRAKRFKLIEDAQAAVSKNPREADRMMDEADRLRVQIERVERADELNAETYEARRNGGEVHGSGIDFEAALDRYTATRREGDLKILLNAVARENTVFNNWLRHGPQAVTEDAHREIYAKRFKIQAALGVSSDPGGGYTVPTGFYAQIISAQKAYGGMLTPDVPFLFDTATGNAMPIPTDNDTGNIGALLSENTQVSTQDVPFGAVTLNAYTYTSKLVLVSRQLLQDSAFDIGAWLSLKLGERIGRAVNTHYTTGDGASKPSGVIPGATLGYTAGGSTSSGSTTICTFDDLVELEHSVDPAYRKNATFMFADATLKVIKKLKDGIGRPLWRAALAENAPDTIDGYPFVINQDMAPMAPSAKSVAFGDFKHYFARRVVGVQLQRLTERYADFNQVGFLAFQRFDGQLVDPGTHPIKFLQNSAS